MAAALDRALRAERRAAARLVALEKQEEARVEAAMRRSHVFDFCIDVKVKCSTPGCPELPFIPYGKGLHACQFCFDSDTESLERFKKGMYRGREFVRSSPKVFFHSMGSPSRRIEFADQELAANMCFQLRYGKRATDELELIPHNATGHYGDTILLFRFLKNKLGVYSGKSGDPESFRLDGFQDECGDFSSFLISKLGERHENKFWDKIVPHLGKASKDGFTWCEHERYIKRYPPPPSNS